MKRLAALATAGLLSLSATATPNVVDGKANRDGVDLFYKIVGAASGDYVLVLSGGPGEDIHSMQGIADGLGKKYRCIMWEQRGTGRSKLSKYDESTINLTAYIDDIEALRKQLRAEKFSVVGNSWGMILGLAYAGTHPDAVRAVVTIGSGPITFDYLGVFSDNQIARLGACEAATSGPENNSMSTLKVIRVNKLVRAAVETPMSFSNASGLKLNGSGHFARIARQM